MPEMFEHCLSVDERKVMEEFVARMRSFDPLAIPHTLRELHWDHRDLVVTACKKILKHAEGEDCRQKVDQDDPAVCEGCGQYWCLCRKV